MAKLARDVVRVDAGHQVNGGKGVTRVVGDPQADTASLQGRLKKPNPLALVKRKSATLSKVVQQFVDSIATTLGNKKTGMRR